MATFPGAQWLQTVSAGLGVLAYESGALCATDPPGFPTFNAADVVALITADAGSAGHTARQKVSDTVATILWYQLCKCDVGAQPTAPSGPTQPTGYAVTPQPATASTPCGGPFTQGGQDVSDNAVHVVLGPAFFEYSLSFITLTTRSQVNGAVHNGITWSLKWRDNNLNQVDATISIFRSSGTQFTNTFYPPAGASQYEVSVQSFGASTDRAFSTVTLYCGSAGAIVAAPSTAPDPTSAAMLAQIYQAVTLIQRQVVPFGYVAGAVHFGLTGAGQLTVADLIGAKIVVTATTPGTIGVQAGDPEFLWGLGWINWGSADGFAPREWLTSTDTVSLPSAAGAYTLLGYSLSAGVTVTITELVREP